MRTTIANQVQIGLDSWVTPALVAGLRLYTRSHILRFGQYALDMDSLPRPLASQPLLFEQTL